MIPTLEGFELVEDFSPVPDFMKLDSWKGGRKQVNLFLNRCGEKDGVDLEAALQFSGSQTRDERLDGWFNFLISSAAIRFQLSEPDVVIGRGQRGQDKPYLNRWYLLPRNPFFNAYLHEFLRSDIDEALHDHPWRSLSFILKGTAIEHTIQSKTRDVEAGQVMYRGCPYPHRIELVEEKPLYTLFLTGPIQREWGFHCPEGWKPWHEFLGGKNNYGGKKEYPGCAG